jgi:hypothetical protein
MVVGGGKISHEALYFKRFRREAAERFVSHALELCGYTSEEVHWLDGREAAKWAQQRDKWAARGEADATPRFGGNANALDAYRW